MGLSGGRNKEMRYLVPMDPILWLSGADVAATGVCDLEQTAGIVQEAFRLYDGGQAVIAP